MKLSDKEKDDITDDVIESRDVEEELTADEMFEKLGYENLPTEINFGGIDIYGKEDKRIEFFNDKTYAVYNSIDNFEYIDMQELKAINEKVKELGWVDE